jgi:phenylpyruvate tautomerase PptA (4-oxalocrotonate tautomerase family)
MPLVRIDMLKGRTDAEVAAIGDAVQRAMVETINVPERDRFQVINEHAPGRLVYNDAYLGVKRTDRIVIIQVFLSKGRTAEQKQAFYATCANYLEAAGMRREDITITFTESTREDWSFGNGVAQYVVLPREEWK